MNIRTFQGGSRAECFDNLADAVTLFDTDGISVKFMNHEVSGNNVKTAQDVLQFIAQVFTSHSAREFTLLVQ